jgi:hypothetical protein
MLALARFAAAMHNPITASVGVIALSFFSGPFS